MGRIDTLSVASAFVRALALTGLTVKTARYIPRPIKWLVVFLLALNIRGFPLAWHGKFSFTLILEACHRELFDSFWVALRCEIVMLMPIRSSFHGTGDRCSLEAPLRGKDTRAFRTLEKTHDHLTSWTEPIGHC